MTKSLFRKQYSVHTYESDSGGRVRSVSLLNFLQDAAGEHAAALGWSVADLWKRKMIWVLSRYHVSVRRYPAWGEQLEVITWPSGQHGLFALRDFEVSDASGNTILVATSSWMIIDIERKQAAKIEDVLTTDFLLEKRSLPDAFASLPVLAGAEREILFRVETGHLDFNRHVNNAVYVQWALEAVPEDVLTRRRPVDLEVSYRAEAFYGDTILSKASGPLAPAPGAEDGAAGPVFLHQIVNARTGVELTRLRTAWE